MANEAKKDFNKMLDAPMEPKIVTLDEAGAAKWGGTTMVVPRKTDYDKLIKQVPAGKLVTTNARNNKFRKFTLVCGNSCLLWLQHKNISILSAPSSTG